MATGTIQSYDPDSGKGFISPDSDTDGETIPFDLSEVEGRPALAEGDAVTYEVEGGLAGTYAIDVRRVAARA